MDSQYANISKHALFAFAAGLLLSLTSQVTIRLHLLMLQVDAEHHLDLERLFGERKHECRYPQYLTLVRQSHFRFHDRRDLLVDSKQLSNLGLGNEAQSLGQVCHTPSLMQ